MSAPDYSSFCPLAHELADRAGAVIGPSFRQGVEVDRKRDGSAVTAVDREAEAAMRELLRVRHPRHGVVGEEWGSERVEAEYVWVLDPIDGTGAFISGQPTFGTLVALLHRGRPVVGVVDQVVSGERWTGVVGAGTTFRSAAALPSGATAEPARVRACPLLSQAALYATTPQMFEDEDAAAFEALRQRVAFNRYGLDCYAYGLLASGLVDLVVEASLAAHDFCALVPVVEGAGGVITDWGGRPLGLESDGRVVAAGDPEVHSASLLVLAGGGGERDSRGA